MKIVIRALDRGNRPTTETVCKINLQRSYKLGVYLNDIYPFQDEWGKCIESIEMFSDRIIFWIRKWQAPKHIYFYNDIIWFRNIIHREGIDIIWENK